MGHRSGTYSHVHSDHPDAIISIVGHFLSVASVPLSLSGPTREYESHEAELAREDLDNIDAAHDAMIEAQFADNHDPALSAVLGSPAAPVQQLRH